LNDQTDKQGMRDVSHKPNTLRTATAEALLQCLPTTIAAIRSGAVPKADPLGVARIAGIQAAKNTSLVIPYCHQVPLDSVDVEITYGEDTLRVVASVKAVWKTGVEMEALTCASAAALTLYDMLKIIDDSMEIRSIRLTGKRGGKSDYVKSQGLKIAAGVLVLSDAASRGEREDRSGEAIRRRLESFGVSIEEFKVLPDDGELITEELRRWADTLSLDLVITTGGTGTSPRDVTPEATARVIEREIPGIVEMLRAHGQERNRHAMLSRGIAGLRGNTLFINLPGSPGAVQESLDVLLPWIFHVFDIARGRGHSEP
jgi:cyclic pyranopterin phosphate synthase